MDGTSQPGYLGGPLIEVSGTSAGPVPGIVLLGGDSTVRALDIDRWDAQGILIESNDNTIAGNYLGVAPDGRSSAGNSASGVLIFGASGNTVGGTVAADRNVISGNGDKGVQIQRTTPSSPTPATGNVVEGNYVGTNATGDAPVANALDGISLVWGAQGNAIGGSVPGAGNLVSGNGRIGISVFDTSSGNLIEGNYVGTNAAGAGAVGGNPECGIVLISASNTVGGTSAGARNVISGNSGGCGVTIGGSGSNTIEGNYIGTNAAGTAALGNGRALSDVPGGLGIQSSNNEVGGPAVGAGNVISGNAEPGVWFDTSGATANVVQGNYIGTDSTKTRAIGNSGDGVLIGGGATGNTIGGIAPGDANTIAHNTSDGVEISGGMGDSVEGNSIFANSGLGIALTSGGNGNEPAPAVLSARSSGSSTTLSGTAATGSRVEVFANPSCSDPEGAVFLGSTASPSGNWSLTVPAVSIGNGITATATNLLSDNTSRFSACQANRLRPPVITSITPKSGSIKGGTIVRIVGLYFSAASVSFGSRPASRFTANSPTQITAVSPAGSAPGVVAVSLTAEGGTSTAVTADEFTYTACVVPKLKGKTLRKARKALKRADCRLGKVEPQGRTTGHVTTQSPKAAKVLAPGSKVQVNLS
jgi:parallel beta-helix repeat protein